MLSLILGLIGAAAGAILLVIGLLTVDPEEGWSIPTFLITFGAVYLLGGLILVLASLVFRRLRGTRPEEEREGRESPRGPRDH